MAVRNADLRQCAIRQLCRAQNQMARHASTVPAKPFPHTAAAQSPATVVTRRRGSHVVEVVCMLFFLTASALFFIVLRT